MTLEEKVHGLRLHVIQRAEQLGNVSRACREAGISRALFYRWRQRLERYGQDGEHEVLDGHVRRAHQGEDYADCDRGDRLTSQEVASPEQQDSGNPPEAACCDEPHLAAPGCGRDERRNADTPV